MEMMQVQVPAGVPVGGQFVIQTPSGQQMQVEALVPEGQMMQVQVPAQQPLAVAQVVVQPMQMQQPQMMPGWQPAVVVGYPAQSMTLQEPQLVMGLPVDPTMFVDSAYMSTSGPATDPVPMLDANTASILGAVNKFRVEQRVAWMEAVSQGMCEQRNVYDIYDDATGQPLFTAVEESNGCTRCFCAPHHSFNLKFKPASVGVPKNTLDSLPTLMTMEREGCPAKWGLGCFACTDDCKDGFFLHAGDIQGEAGSTKMSSGRVMGIATQPKMGGGMTPTINVMERMDAQGAKWGAMAKIEGPTVFGGCSELCCESTWPVSRMEASQFESKLRVGDFATITKKRPRGFFQALKEAMTDSDKYTIEFREDVSLAPQQKALMLTSLLQIDYMFFEKDNGMAKCENRKLKITLFECYCLGCM